MTKHTDNKDESDTTRQNLLSITILLASIFTVSLIVIIIASSVHNATAAVHNATAAGTTHANNQTSVGGHITIAPGIPPQIEDRRHAPM